MLGNYEALSLRAGRLSRFFAAMAALSRDSDCAIETADLRKVQVQTWQDERQIEVCLIRNIVPTMSHEEAVKYMERNFAPILEILRKHDLSPKIGMGSGISYKINVVL